MKQKFQATASPPTRITLHPNLEIYSDGFRKLKNAKWLHEKVVDEVQIGVLFVIYNPGFGSYALNRTEFQRLLDGLDEGKVAEAYVQSARYDQGGIVYEERVEARELFDKRLKHMPTRHGSLGEFWSVASLSGDDEDKF
jgi:hypothetical protein